MEVNSPSHGCYGPEIWSEKLFLSLKKMSDQCNGCWEWFDVILHRFLMKMLEFQVDTTSFLCFLILMSVTVRNYDMYKCDYHWIGCLIELTHAVSGLMSFFIEISSFYDKIDRMRRIVDVIPYQTCVRSRNIYFKGSKIGGMPIIA